MVVGYYIAGDTSQQWIIEKDQICFKSDRQLRVVVDGTVVVGARCQASHNDSSSSSSSWLFDHQSVVHLSLNCYCSFSNMELLLQPDSKYIGRGGLVVGRPTAVREDPGSHCGRSCLSRQSLQYTALGTGCAPFLQCLG